MNQSPREWQELTRLTGGQGLVVERVRIEGSGLAIEGAFALPKLAQLGHEDQVFVAAFVGAHGSIKEMETMFGVSYPTIKARLNRLAQALALIEAGPIESARPARGDILDRLERGEITAKAAADLLRARP